MKLRRTILWGGFVWLCRSCRADPTQVVALNIGKGDPGMQMTKTRYSLLTVSLLVVGEGICLLVGIGFTMVSGFGQVPADSLRSEGLTAIAAIGVLLPIVFLVMMRWATAGVISMWTLTICLLFSVYLARMFYELRTFVIAIAAVAVIATIILSASKRLTSAKHSE